MISKTHISAQKPRGRQLNAKVCGSESAIFRLLSFFLSLFNNRLVRVLTVVLARNCLLSLGEFPRTLSVFITPRCVENAIFKFCAHALSSLVPRSQITAFWLGTRLAHASMSRTGFTKFTQLHVVTSQFVMIIPCALPARIEDRTGSRHDSWR